MKIEISIETYEKIKDQILEEENALKEKKKINITLYIKNRFTGEVIYESKKTTYKEAVVEAVEKGVSLRNSNLRNSNLSNSNLSDSNLRNSNLSDSNLSNSNLSDSNLSDSDLRNSNLRNSDLSDSDFENTDLQNAKFYGKTDSPKTLTKKQVPLFLKALGFIIK